jgi:acetylornithine deacetylase
MSEISVALPTLRAIQDAVQARHQWGMSALQKLIEVDSVAPNEKPCQEVLSDLLQKEGLSAQLLPLDDGRLRSTKGFIDAGLPLEDRPNLVAALGGKRAGGHSLILNSHIDTEPWKPEAHRWKTPPLSGAVRDGKIYGRGAVDAKGQVMVAMMAALALRDIGYEPAGRLVLESVVCEEPTGDGTLALCQQGWLADAAIVLEPNDNHVAYGHRGLVGLRFTVEGQAGHAAASTRRSNAIVEACRLVEALNSALDDWAAPSDAIYSPPSFNAGRIQGGIDIYTTPHRCEIECGVRYAPGTYDAIMHHLQERIRQAGTKQELQAPDLLDKAVFVHYDAAEILPTSSLAETLLACVREVASDRHSGVCIAGCDARHFINRYGVPAVIFGPGPLAVAHGVDEYLPIDQWLMATEALALFITRWCG